MFDAFAPKLVKVVFSRYIAFTILLTGENERSPTGRVDPVRGCLNNPSRLG
jgi:hypothetical protein